MTNSKYWRNRFLKERERLLDLRIDATTEQLKWQYQRLLEKTEQELLNMYAKLSEPNGTVNSIYRYNRYYILSADIRNKLQELGIEQTTLITKEMTDLYNQAIEIVGRECNINIALNEDRARAVIDSIWVADGKNWSQRIWQNNEALSAFLQTGLIDTMGAGYNPDNLKRALMKGFATSYYNADRIVRTEYTHIAVTAAIQGYQEAGVKEYRILTTNDCRRCPECRDMDGKVFPITDTEHLPPFHPNCRDTVLAVLPEPKPLLEDNSPKSLIDWYQNKLLT